MLNLFSAYIGYYRYEMEFSESRHDETCARCMDYCCAEPFQHCKTIDIVSICFIVLFCST